MSEHIIEGLREGPAIGPPPERGDRSTWSEPSALEPKKRPLGELGRIAIESERDGRGQLLELHGIRIDRVDPHGHINGVYVASFEDGTKGYFKPKAEEATDVRGESIPAKSQWRREVAACAVDRRLGFGLVPDTVTFVDETHGIGSVQAEAPSEGLDYKEYSPIDQQRMAVLDYVLANTDRHDHNYKTSSIGRPAAIDNGLCLPDDDKSGIRSEWVGLWYQRPLDNQVAKEVAACDDRALVDELTVLGIGKDAIDGCFARLNEVRANGRIEGSAWGGPIYGGGTLYMNEIRGRMEQRQ